MGRIHKDTRGIHQPISHTLQKNLDEDFFKEINLLTFIFYHKQRKYFFPKVLK